MMTARILTPTYWAAGAFNFPYVLVQRLIIWPFKQSFNPLQLVPPSTHLSHGRIAIVGAGMTGVACAAHAIVHGFDVVIFEQTGTVGGIWATVNKTSGLRMPSCLYRFHPGVLWSRAFPRRDEILREIRRIYEEYRLEPRARFGSRVTSVNRVRGDGWLEGVASSEEARPRWTIDDGVDGEFDAVVLAVGTRGAPEPPDIPGLSPVEQSHRYPDGVRVVKVMGGSNPGEKFGGDVVHSSRLRLEVRYLEGETVLVIGNNASGVDAVETALAKGAKRCVMVAGDDKWIIRQNIFNTILIALQRFARQKWFSVMLEEIIKMANYHGAPQLVPAHLKIFEDTRIINDEFVNFVKQRRCEYVRGEVDCLTRECVRVRVRDREEMPGKEMRMREYKGNVLVYTTGFSEPKMAFVESEPFPEGYKYPNLYLGSFSTKDWSVVSMNPGIVGHWHVGINMRILLTFLMYPHARPTPKDMKAWVDSMGSYQHDIGRYTSSFLNYVELAIWLCFFYVSHIHRLKWVFFVMQGWGKLEEELKVAQEI